MRKKAESLLKMKQNEMSEALKDTDIQKLVHELQVHQIELEMQNEELHLAHGLAEMALKKYTMLFDLAPLGYFFLDSEVTICDVNFIGAELLGERRFSLLNSNFKLFVSEESLLVFTSFFKKVFSSEAKESCEVTLGYKDHHLVQVYIEGVVIKDEQKCLMSVVDISKFRKK